MLRVLAIADDVVDAHVGGAVGVHDVRIGDLFAGFGSGEGLTDRLPFVAVKEFQQPELVSGGGGTGLEGDMHLGSGLDVAAAVEEPVVTRPGTGDAGALVGHVQRILLVAVGRGQVEGDIGDVAQALDRIDLARGRKGLRRIVDVIGADPPLDRVRDQGFILAPVLEGRDDQVAGRAGQAHRITGQDDLVKIDVREAERCRRIHDFDRGGRDGNLAADQRAADLDELHGLAVVGDDVIGHVRGVGIVDGAARPGAHLVHEEGGSPLEGGPGTVDRDLVAHGDFARTLDVDVGSAVRQDESGRGHGRDGGIHDLGNILVLEGEHLGHGQFGHTHVGVARLPDAQLSLPLDGCAAEDDLTPSGHVDDPADDVVAHADGDLHRSFSGHGAHRDPILVHIGHPGSVRIDVDNLVGGGHRFEIEELLGRQDGLGQLFDRLLLASAEDGRQGQESGQGTSDMMCDSHNLHRFNH